VRLHSNIAVTVATVLACFLGIVLTIALPIAAQQLTISLPHEATLNSQPPAPIVYSPLEMATFNDRPLEGNVFPDQRLAIELDPRTVIETDQLLEESIVESLDDEVIATEELCCPSGPIFEKYYYWGAGDPEPSNWTIGTGDSLGFFSFGTASEEPRTEGTLSSEIGLNWHLVSGPRQTDLPPRIYDLFYHWHYQDQITDRFSFEIGFRFGVFTDFEGSVRDGVRFPGHYVGYYELNDCVTLVGGVDYLDRDDIQVLPVGGVSIFLNEDLRADLVFPQPRIAWRINDQWMHVRGEFGGSSWAVERTTLTDDVVVYRDYRVLMGWQDVNDDGETTVYEIGYVFDRQLNYRSGIGNYKPRDTVILRSVIEY
jgi:hypothetical protein